MSGRVTLETAEAIREMIRSGSAGNGGHLPSERELAEKLCVSRATLRSALEALRESGDVETESGSGGGTSVSKDSPYWNLYSLMDTSFGSHEPVEHPLAMPQGVPSSIRSGGRRSETTILSAKEIPAPERIAQSLELELDETVYEVRRVRKAGGKPISLECAYLVPRYFPRLLGYDLRTSVYTLMLKGYGIKLSRITESLEVIGARKEAAELLEVPEGAPLFLSETCAKDENACPLEFSRDLYRTDRIRFVTENAFHT